MVGKVSLLLVMGFSLIFLIFGQNFNSVAIQSVDNYVDYYNKTVSHSIALDGANLGANALYLNKNWTAGYNLPISGGNINVSIQTIDAGQFIKKIISVGTFEGKTDTVEIITSPSRFSRFAYYSQSEGNDIRWISTDTVFGPFHTEDNLKVDNHPVFGDSGYTTTIAGDIIYVNNKESDEPIMLGPFEAHRTESLPLDGLQPLRDAAVSDGKVFQLISTSNLRYQNFYLTFNSDQITYRILGQKKISGHWNSFDSSYTVAASSISNNGVLYLNSADKDGDPIDINLKGTVKGKFSVVGDGNIFLDDDIKYSSDPRVNSSSEDLLGILAQNNVYITDNNYTQNIEIDAAIYCQDGGFGAANAGGRGSDGDINLYGGITQNIRRAVGSYGTRHDGSIYISNGYNKRYRYDSRLMVKFPPFFPTSEGFRILSWKE